MEGYYSIKDAANKLGVNAETLRRWDKAGKLKATRLSNNSYRWYSIEIINKIIKEGFQEEEVKRFPASIYSDKIIDFHSATVPNATYFTSIVHDIAVKVEHFTDCEIIDGPYDKNRDIVGYYKESGKKKLVYIQTKREKGIGEKKLKEELDGLYKHINEGKIKKPDKIIFALSIDLNSTQRDLVRNYCKQLFENTESIFWCAKELDQKVKSDNSILKRFILTGMIDTSGSYSDVEKDNDLKIINPKNTSKNPLINIDDNVSEHALLDEKIKRTAKHIELGEFEEAKEKLLELNGSTPNSGEFMQERSRILNNLGVCYKDSLPADLDKAINFFNQSLDINSEMWKATCNLVLSLVSRNKDGDFEKAWKTIEKLWKEKGPDDPLILAAYLRTFTAKNGEKKALVEALKIQANAKGKNEKKTINHPSFRYALSSLLIDDQKFEEAETLINKNINEDPEDIDALYLKALIKLNMAGKPEGHSHIDLLPVFSDYSIIEEASSLLKIVYVQALEKKRYDLLPEIYNNWNVCRLWLWRSRGIKLEKFSYPLDDKTKLEPSKILEIQDLLNSKDYQSAYEKLTEFGNGKTISIREKYHLSNIFLVNGSPEIAIKILQEIEDSNISLPSHFWLDKSICEVLLGNKSGAIQCGKKAKEIANNEDKEKQRISLSHNGALISRYEKEGDRLLETMLEFDEKFPELNAVKKLNINKKEDKQFIIDTQIDYRNWFDKTVKFYEENQLPAYTLEKPFKRTFIELWSGRGVGFPWEYTIPNLDFEKSLIDLLDNANGLVFDYMSLLTITKANLLSYLTRTKKKIYVHFSTFEKIQNELIQYENSSLRSLWDFLRNSNNIEFYYAKEDLEGDLIKLKGVLDDWILQSIQLAKNQKFIFVTDDLRLFKAVRNFGVETINSFAILKSFYNKEYFDKKSYSQALGSVADCVYTFISFTGDDLHEIVWLDDYELKRRSYHLINQIFLSGSDIISFIGVFIDFSVKLWSSGALSKDKIFWLKFLTNNIDSLVMKWSENHEPIDDVKQVFVDKFAELWTMSIQSGTLDDLKILNRNLDEIFSTLFLKKIKANIQNYLNLRIEQLLFIQNKELVLNELNKIDSGIAGIYQSIKLLQNAPMKDSARQITSCMREVIYQLLHKIAPDNEIKLEKWFQPNHDSKSGITHLDRFTLIKQKTKNKSVKKEIEEKSTEYIQLINNLSRTIHSHGDIVNVEAAKDIYKANNLIKLIIKSF